MLIKYTEFKYGIYKNVYKSYINHIISVYIFLIGISKLDTLIAGQKDIESRLSNLEKKLDQNNNDMIDSDGIKVIEMYIIN